jgi:hypothetical protein
VDEKIRLEPQGHCSRRSHRLPEEEGSEETLRTYVLQYLPPVALLYNRNWQAS